MKLEKGSEVQIITDLEEGAHFLTKGSVAVFTGKIVNGLYEFKGSTEGGECEQYLEESDFELL